MRGALPPFVVFLGAFLVFGVQPLTGRTLLPVFGGTASVWVVCLAVFQALSLAGYCHAHLMSRLPLRGAGRAQAALLALSVPLALLPVFLPDAFREWAAGAPYPALREAALICVFAGLPCVLLSACGILAQAWLARRGERNPYRLYAVSNAGSLCGLLAYPFLLEPFVPLRWQWAGFAALLAAYAVALLLFLRRLDPFLGGGAEGEAAAVPPGGDTAPSPCRAAVLWVVLPASSCFLLNAATSYLTQEVAPVPLLWVALLAAFLLSYVAGFSERGGKNAGLFCALMLVPLLGCALGLRRADAGEGYAARLACGLALVFLGGAFIHSWLYRLRPRTGRLTSFYACLAAGGAAGGMLAGLAAPALFDSVLEYPLALALAAVLAFLFAAGQARAGALGMGALGAAGAAALACLVAVAAGVLLPSATAGGRQTVMRARNFYAAVRVDRVERVSEHGERIVSHHLMHGNVTHGYQFEAHYLRQRPTAYYGADGGGLAVTGHTAYAGGTPMRVAVIGLGVGTMAAWGRAGDVYRFYEINPQVTGIARDTGLFTYLSDSPAETEVVTADARVALERERAAGEAPYDVIVVDAYSGDAVPIQLVTREAFRLLFDRLAPGGVLAIHASSWHINLLPLCKAGAGLGGMACAGIVSGGGALTQPATWVMVGAWHLPAGGAPVREIDWDAVADIALPEDGRGSLLGLVSYNFTPPVRERSGDALFDAFRKTE